MFMSVLMSRHVCQDMCVCASDGNRTDVDHEACALVVFNQELNFPNKQAPLFPAHDRFYLNMRANTTIR